MKIHFSAGQGPVLAGDTGRFTDAQIMYRFLF